MNRAEKEALLMLLREQAIRKSRQSFWEFCKHVDDIEFYRDDRWHLRFYCEALQGLYERRLTPTYIKDLLEKYCPEWFQKSFEMPSFEDPNRVYTKLIINLPPRMGKSRTLINFCKWVLGRDITNKVMTCSYNDDLAQEFSRYTRDGIQEEQFYPHDIVFGTVFPEARVKKGDASYKKWSLEGNFFNYLGAGTGGSITGKGANITIVDDPIKDAEQAFNEAALEKLWLWYSGTFKSRAEEIDGVPPIEIINHTRWSEADICGRILGNAKESKDWLVLRMEAYYAHVNEYLCPTLLSPARYEELKRVIDPIIFIANYHQKETSGEGRLYKNLKTYSPADIPRDEHGNCLFEQTINYTDTADMGTDFLASITGDVYQGRVYIKDVVYTMKGMEETEPMTAKMLFENKVHLCEIESNNGGRGFARNVERLLWETHKSRLTAIRWKHQTKNKKARILTHATYIMNNIYFPDDWHVRFPEFYKAITTYQREGKNKNDDGPDALTGLAEMVSVSPSIRTL